MSTLGDRLRALADEADALTQVESPPAQKTLTGDYPRMIRVKDTNIMANAPLHPDWVPSMAAWTHGHSNHPDGTPKTWVGDPSNAPEGYPNRSRSGFPLVYSNVRWDGKAWIGAPIGQPRVNCGEVNYDTEAELLDALTRRMPDRVENLKEEEQARTSQVYTGQFPAANFILGPQEGREAAFIYAARRLLQDKGGPHLIFDCNLFSGTFHDLSRLISYGEQEQIYEHKSYQQTVDDFPDTPVKRAVMAVLEAATGRTS